MHRLLRKSLWGVMIRSKSVPALGPCRQLSIAPPASSRTMNTNLSHSRLPDEPQIAFISGSIEPNEDYFLQHYAALIDEAITKGHTFIMGSALGTDTMARHYLIKKGVPPSRMTVYFGEFQRRSMAMEISSIRAQEINVKVEGQTMTLHDAAMTRNSHHDILRYMSVEEQMEFYGARYRARVSGTEKNEQRRKALLLHACPALMEKQEPDNPEGAKTSPSGKRRKQP